MAVSVKHAPDKNKGVSSLGAPTRASGGSHLLTQKWKVMDWLTDQDSSSRATAVIVTWKLFLRRTSKDADGKERTEDSTATRTVTFGIGTTEHSQSLDNFVADDGRTFTRASFYPIGGYVLRGVSASVQTKNNVGRGKLEPGSTLWFTKPRAPEISEGEFDASSGRVTFTIETDPGEDRRERHYTKQRIVVYDSQTNKTIRDYSETVTRTTGTLSHDVPDYREIPAGHHVRVTVSATAYGYAGTSETTWKSFYYCMPGKPTIRAQKDASGVSRAVIVDTLKSGAADPTGRAVLGLITNNRTVNKPGEPIAPVDGVRLVKLVSSPYFDKSSIPATADWQETDVVDNGSCTALSIPVAELMPEAGTMTWIRVKSWHIGENVLWRYSDAAPVSMLYRPAPTAADDVITVWNGDPANSRNSLDLSSDGTSVVAWLYWAPSGSTDDSTYSQVSWSTDPDAWQSTTGPKVSDVTWTTGTGSWTWTDPDTQQRKTWTKRAKIIINGLKEGETVYVRARRVLEGESGTSYGGWSAIRSAIPGIPPSDVVLSTPSVVATGAGIPCTWDYTGGTQARWMVQAVLNQSIRTLASGDGVTRQVELSPSVYGDSVNANGGVMLRVGVSTGGELEYSPWNTVNIAEPPTIAISTSTVAVQPATFDVECTGKCDLACTLTANGTTVQEPWGTRSQLEGDTVWTGTVTPEWADPEDEGDPYTATVELPAGLDLVDLASYRLDVTATDEMGLTASQTAELDVDWARKAPYPTGCLTVTPTSTVDDDGVAHRECALSIASGFGAATDLFELYRVTQDGAELAVGGIAAGWSGTDPYAPFGTGAATAYRIALRTADGDVSWHDVPYEIAFDAMRLDFGEAYVEMPYNIEVSDSFAKDVETRKHLDGTVEGYWNEGARRTGKLSTVLPTDTHADEIAALRAMARYAGAVYVRTPDGHAYAADVQVSDAASSARTVTVELSTAEVASGGFTAVENETEGGE